MYYTHELRTNLQEWKNRLQKSSSPQFASQFLFFFKKIDSEPILKGIIDETSQKHKIDLAYVQNWLEKYESGDDFVFDDPSKQAACFYHLSKYIISKNGANNVIMMSFIRSGSGFEERKIEYIETFINPVVEFLHDQIDISNSILYLLEKYKKRVEWFKREELYTKYKATPKQSEQILEDDLRLFLFDQGVDYPFSTPKSFSGRADLVGLINTKDPLIAEIKIFDSSREYRKERIYSGLSQIIKYTNDYNKDCGFLIIFNIDSAEIVFTLNHQQNKFPTRILINNKIYYFIVINLDHNLTASKIGKTKIIEITENELLQQI